MLNGLCYSVNAQLNFEPFKTYSAGISVIPASVAVGDFNHDGKPDIAAANWWGTNIGVLILGNNGDGTFAAPDLVSLSSAPNNDEPWYVSVGDLNGDSYPDMVTSNSTLNVQSSISVFLNNGAGSFLPPVFYEAGYRPDKAIIKDLNGDDKPDIVAANGQDTFISVYLNNGNGSFAPQVTYFNGYTPHVVAGDFNSDGKVDLVVDSRLTNTSNSDIGISIMLNDGNGNFTVSPPVITNNPFLRLREVADLNNDNKPDLIFSDGGIPKRILISFNSGNATFNSPVSYPVDATNTVVVIDMNNDNKKDLVISDANSNFNFIFLNTGGGAMALPIKVPTKAGLTDLCVADLNGDNKMDIVNGAAHDSLIAVTLQGQYNTSVSTPELGKANINVYPNPGKEIVTVLSSVNENLKIYDPLGRLLMERKIVKGTNVVDIKRLSAGFYIFVTGEQKIKFEKRN